MTADRNKTELTQNIVRLVALWLNDKGFKPVETEVGLERAWVADVAGVCAPTPTEKVQLKLIKPAPRWNAIRDEIVFREKYDAWEAELGAIPNILTAAVEVKTSVNDFRGDTKWTRPWPTNLCFVAMPEGLIPQEKWPAGWGVILFDQKGTRVRRAFPSRIEPVSVERQRDVILSLAMRRENVTGYARMREMQKVTRMEDADRKTLARITNVIGFVRSVMNGKPVEQAKISHGIRAFIPDYILKDLVALCPQKLPPTIAGTVETAEAMPQTEQKSA